MNKQINSMDPNIITSSFLFAKEKYNHGIENCFYCGINCDKKYHIDEYVKKTFTNLDIVKFQHSKYCCGCCVESLRGKAETRLIDDEIKIGVAGKAYLYSWVLTDTDKFAGSKKHIYFFRDKILNPPCPPFSIILADSGKKQLIFRGIVNYDTINFIVLFEEEHINCNVYILQEYMKIAKYICSFIGKVSLQLPDTFINHKIMIDNNANIYELEKWIKFYSSPMGRLISWICPNKEECKNEVIKC